MPQWARRTADDRAAVLDALAHFAAAANAATATSPIVLARFAESWNAGHFTTNCDAHSLIPQVSAPTILRWHRLRARGGLAALAPRYGNRRGSSIIDTNPAVRELLLAMIARYGKHLRAPRVAEAIAATFPTIRISKSRSGKRSADGIARTPRYPKRSTIPTAGKANTASRSPRLTRRMARATIWRGENGAARKDERRGKTKGAER